MKVSTIRSNTLAQKDTNNKKKQNPTFGSAMPILGAAGTMMQWIESKGYFISFLIQDGLGMTAPRVWTGFKRDKEITGHYNKQEGLEVLGREGMTGPYIVGVAPAVLALSGRFCKSTNTNTRLIKRFGDSLKNMVKSPEFENGSKKDKEQALANITEYINSKITETSSDLYKINKVYVGDDNTKQLFSIKDAFTALKDYGTDAIKNNKNSETLDEVAAENIKNNFAAKRLGVNVANIAITLGGLSYLPKIYAKSDVSPGAAALEHAKQKQQLEQSGEVAFKGKGINNDGILSKIGKFLTKKVPEKAQELLEYNGYNFTKTTFALLSTLGLLLPRVKRAWDRAQIDENGKRDMTEINEILLRDTVSSLSVVFAVPLLTKMIVKSYENKVGFVLTNKASEGKTPFKKFLDVINPYSDLEVLSVADLDSIYGNIDSKKKLLNFADFVDSKGGDLEKILSKSDNANLMFNDKTFTLESIKNLSRKEKNSKIKTLFNSEFSDDVIKSVMKGTGDIKSNKIAKMARGLNSLPGAISTIIISPILLGALIPMLTYHNTRKANAKKLQQQN